MNRRTIGAIVAIVTVIGAGGVMYVGGSDTSVHITGHRNTALDASGSTTPPLDWRSGYTRTGAICYSQDATGVTAKCFAADVLPYMGDATDIGWPVELTQVNRFPYNASASCDGTPFVCSTATMDSTTADPAGGTTASTLTMGGGSADATAFGYGNSKALDLRLYMKCPAGIFDATHIGGEGHWTVDGTALGSAWKLIYTGHAAVTEVQAWKSDGSGGLRMRVSGNDCSIWHMTATEVASTWHHNTIPTADATGSTVGTAAWVVDNSSGAYWAATGVTKVETLSQYSGTCWSCSGTMIKLTGASGCTATWYALGLTWSH